MVCPRCSSSDLDLEKSNAEGNRHYEEYTCLKCNCHFAWDMTCTIIDKGDGDDE